MGPGTRGEVRKTIMERCKSTVRRGGGTLHEIKQITVVKLRSYQWGSSM